MEKLADQMKKLEDGVVEGYKKIENGVVTGYKKIESGVVNGYHKVEDTFVNAFLAREGETAEEAKARLARQKGKTEEDKK